VIFDCIEIAIREQYQGLELYRTKNKLTCLMGGSTNCHQKKKSSVLGGNNTHLLNSDSSLALLFSSSSVFILKLVSVVLADLLASEWAR